MKTSSLLRGFARVIALVSILVAWPSDLCVAQGRPAPNLLPVDPCQKGPWDSYDMVQWMVQTYPGHESSYLLRDDGTGTVSDYSIHDPQHHRFYRISSTQGYGNEVYDYDDNYIYIRRETRFDSPRTFLRHPNYIWCQRHAVVLRSDGRCCNQVVSDSHYDWYENCLPVRSGGPLFHISVGSPALLNVGGNVGTVMTLKLISINMGNIATEIYWYAQGWGMVHFQQWTGLPGTSHLNYEEWFNTIRTPQPPLVLDCGIGY